MAKFKSEELLRDLSTDVDRIRESAQFFSNVDKTKMIYSPSEGKWSIVQILEHLNAYGRYYLPAVEHALTEKVTGKAAWFNSGFWGDYFTKSMKPTNVYEVKNKMKAMKAYSFSNSLNVDTVQKEFNEQQDKLKDLLAKAGYVDLNAIRIPITLTKLVKLKLGDVFRFLIAHEQRHMVQARNTLNTVGIKTDQFPVLMTVAGRP
ncbi:MAG: DinB family protein [Flaviaesturariibacter sp.]|nr:DinB family protein [Flaviaesturariibacter sp.]